MLEMDVKYDEQKLIDVQNLIKRFSALKGRVPPGIYGTIFQYLEEGFEQTFNKPIEPISKRVRFGLGKQTMIGSGDLRRSLGHNPGGLGIRNTRTGEFSGVSYANQYILGQFQNQKWIPEENMRVNPLTGKYYSFTILNPETNLSLDKKGDYQSWQALFSKGKEYTIPMRTIFNPDLIGGGETLKKMLLKWLIEFSKGGDANLIVGVGGQY